MVRSGLSAGGLLRYRGDRMNADPTTSDVSFDWEHPEAGSAHHSRAWSIAAAMEPVPPLAPPPALPGQGVAVVTTPRPAEHPPGPRMVIAYAVLTMAIAIVVTVLLLLGR